MNALLVVIFSPAQIAGIVLVSILLAALIGLNVWVLILLHKRGERKLYTEQLQRQREALMMKLQAMRAGEQVEFSGPIRVGGGLIPQSEEEEAEAEEQPKDDEEEEVLDVELTEGGKVIRYNRSFTARITQADNDLKARYSELKNYLLGFKGIKCRMSWRQETFHLGRKSIASFVVRGKTLCLCLATDPNIFADTKYKVEDTSSEKKDNQMPCRYRITSDRKTSYAKELIEIIMAGFGVEKLEKYEAEDFTLPYKSTASLIKRRLIKVIGGAIPDAAREDALAAAKSIRYNRSFSARLIQSDDSLKGFYSKLKNHILSFGEVKVSDSWKRESYLYKRNCVASFIIRGKTLCLCLALDPVQFEGTKFKVENYALIDKNTRTPLLYRIKNARRVNYAMQLINQLFKQLDAVEIDQPEEVNYVVPFVATETLIRRGLIRVVRLGQDGEALPGQEADGEEQDQDVE